ncbi:MAG: hypothetical protein HQM16_19170 [Deltaproteobacteria bacterium]|nr:hypothetical protein [Deltaproteobacteria bacterium]
MKTILFFFCLVNLIGFCLVANAETESFAELQTVFDQSIDRCRTLPQNVLPLYIQSVEWNSPDRAVGVIKAKDTNAQVRLNGRLEDIFKDSLKNAFSKCGFKLSESSSNAVVIKASIKDFYVKAANDGLVGKSTGSVDLTLTYTKANAEQYATSQHSFETEYKAGPSRKLKRLEKILNQLLVDVINDVAFSETVYRQIERMSKD